MSGWPRATASSPRAMSGANASSSSGANSSEAGWVFSTTGLPSTKSWWSRSVGGMLERFPPAETDEAGSVGLRCAVARRREPVGPIGRDPHLGGHVLEEEPVDRFAGQHPNAIRARFWHHRRTAAPLEFAQRPREQAQLARDDVGAAKPFLAGPRVRLGQTLRLERGPGPHRSATASNRVRSSSSSSIRSAREVRDQRGPAAATRSTSRSSSGSRVSAGFGITGSAIRGAAS